MIGSYPAARAAIEMSAVQAESAGVSVAAMLMISEMLVIVVLNTNSEYEYLNPLPCAVEMPPVLFSSVKNKMVKIDLILKIISIIDFLALPPHFHGPCYFPENYRVCEFLTVQTSDDCRTKKPSSVIVSRIF